MVTRPYWLTLLIALDQWCAAVLFNRPDLTISAMCWAVRTGVDGPLKLSPFQRAVLMRTGNLLEWVNPGHCESARQADLERAKWAKYFLT